MIFLLVSNQQINEKKQEPEEPEPFLPPGIDINKEQPKKEGGCC